MPQCYHKMHGNTELIQIKSIIFINVWQVPEKERTNYNYLITNTLLSI